MLPRLVAKPKDYDTQAETLANMFRALNNIKRTMVQTTLCLARKFSIFKNQTLLLCQHFGIP